MIDMIRIFKRGLKWKHKGSLENQYYWKLFCWDKHVKEYFPEVDTGESLRQNHEGMFYWQRQKTKDVLLKQAYERICNKGLPANTHVLFHITLYSYIPSVGTPYREMYKNKNRKTSGFFDASADWGWLAEWSQLRLAKWPQLRQMLMPHEARPREDIWCLEGIKKAWMNSDGVWG